MIPLQFGTTDRPLFGLYTPAGASRRRHGVVLCNPWGGEAIRAHRSLRLLAEFLAADGHDVLRFDYSGTGDSFGDPDQVRLADWVEDADCALDELCSVSGVTRVALVGLRLGSWVAASVAAGHPDDVDRVVLWEPMYQGAEHLRELRAHRRVVAPDGSEHLAGFPLTQTFRAELEQASLDGMPGRFAHVLVVRSARPGDAPPARRPTGREVVVMEVDAPACWVEERVFGAGAVPADLLRKVTAWLA